MAGAASPGSGRGTLIGVLIATVLAAAGGAAFGIFLGPKAGKPADADQSGGAHGSAGGKEPRSAGGRQVPDKLPPTHIRVLQPATAGLTGGTRAWVRLEAAMLVDGPSDKDSEVLAARVAEDLVAYLRSMKLEAFSGPQAFQWLKSDISERARSRGGERVKELFILGLVIE